MSGRLLRTISRSLVAAALMVSGAAVSAEIPPAVPGDDAWVAEFERAAERIVAAVQSDEGTVVLRLPLRDLPPYADRMHASDAVERITAPHGGIRAFGIPSLDGPYFGDTLYWPSASMDVDVKHCLILLGNVGPEFMSSLTAKAVAVRMSGAEAAAVIVGHELGHCAMGRFEKEPSAVRPFGLLTEDGINQREGVADVFALLLAHSLGYDPAVFEAVAAARVTRTAMEAASGHDYDHRTWPWLRAALSGAGEVPGGGAMVLVKQAIEIVKSSPVPPSLRPPSSDAPHPGGDQSIAPVDLSAAALDSRDR